MLAWVGKTMGKPPPEALLSSPPRPGPSHLSTTPVSMQRLHLYVSNHFSCLTDAISFAQPQSAASNDPNANHDTESPPCPPGPPSS